MLGYDLGCIPSLVSSTSVWRLSKTMTLSIRSLKSVSMFSACWDAVHPFHSARASPCRSFTPVRGPTPITANNFLVLAESVLHANCHVRHKTWLQFFIACHASLVRTLPTRPRLESTLRPGDVAWMKLRTSSLWKTSLSHFLCLLEPVLKSS
jgi:hypothetical protein